MAVDREGARPQNRIPPGEALPLESFPLDSKLSFIFAWKYA
jgi:hypothetical protein